MARSTVTSPRNRTQLNWAPASLRVKYICPELWDRRLVISPVTQTVPICSSSERRMAPVNSLTERIFLPGAMASGGKSSPKSHWDLEDFRMAIGRSGLEAFDHPAASANDSEMRWIATAFPE